MWKKTKYLLILEVLNQALHIVQVGFQLDLVVAQTVELSAEVANVGLEHGVNVGTGCGLLLEEGPFSLQHLVLLLQEAYLSGGKGRKELLFQSEHKSTPY